MKELALKIVLFVPLFFAVTKGIDFFAARGMTDTHLTVAKGAISQYDMAMRNNDRSNACFQAGVAASAYLSAKAESDYRKWQSIYDACK